MIKLQRKSCGLPSRGKITNRILQRTKVACEQLSVLTDQIEEQIVQALERNKVSPELFVHVDEAKALQSQACEVLRKRKKIGKRRPSFDRLEALYSQMQQLIKFMLLRTGQTELSRPTLRQPKKETEKVQKMESKEKLGEYSVVHDKLHPYYDEYLSGKNLIWMEETKESKENCLKDKIEKVGRFSEQERGIASESKGKQHLGENVIKADSATCSTSIHRVECQDDEIEGLHPVIVFSAASSEEEVVQLQVYEPKSDHDAGLMELFPSKREEDDAAQFSELSKSTLHSAILSPPSPPIEVGPKLISLEVERISPSEQADSGSSFSRSNDIQQSAYKIVGGISSEVENGKMGPILSTSILIEGELRQLVDINLEIPRWTSSSEWPNPSDGFLCCNYRIVAREKNPVESKLMRGKSSDGNYSSSEPLESFRATNFALPEHLTFGNEGDGMVNPPSEGQWKQASVMVLRDNTFPSLPEKPDSPNLILLFLQRNRSLRSIPQSFFSTMHSLRVLDLSYNRIHTLPSSLFTLRKLQVLILCNCSFLCSLPPEIKGLEHIEVLDLLGTELFSVPDELGQLTNLKYLQISFYGTDDGRECDHLPPVLFSPQIVSMLQKLEALSIIVHPEDLRWVRNSEAIIQDVGNLEHLSCLQFYFPKVKIMEQFTKSPSWKKISTNKFKFVVGQDVKRIVDRVSADVEHKFTRQDRSLRCINGNEVPEAVKTVLNHVTAFYLDHHFDIRSLSEFGITNCDQLLFCVVRECPDIEAIISEKIDQQPAYPSLEYLGLHYLWKLESICKDQLPEGSFCALKSLTLDTCPKLKYIFSESLLQCFCNLEELVVEDCESLKGIIEKSTVIGNGDFSALPHLRKVKLCYLPQLMFLWERERSLELPARGFQLESVTLHSCPKLDRSLLRLLVKELIEED